MIRKNVLLSGLCAALFILIPSSYCKAEEPANERMSTIEKTHLETFDDLDFNVFSGHL